MNSNECNIDGAKCTKEELLEATERAMISRNDVLRRCNGVRNKKDRFIIFGKPSGNHAIRKACISELHDSQLLPDRMISDFAGHKDISTTQKYYIHSVTPLTDKADVFSKVFKSKAV